MVRIKMLELINTVTKSIEEDQRLFSNNSDILDEEETQVFNDYVAFKQNIVNTLNEIMESNHD